ncbi:MAG: hypothetical protein PHP52_07880 [Bacteroidales bacterium]|nr:hypothetical protein [Bacteroidales bacterium]MDD4218298.1 hypothetical protein [Bacteroidales bacterium]MDY0142562.1 hypothetical protein [Bacteroidales bacterium]
MMNSSGIVLMNNIIKNIMQEFGIKILAYDFGDGINDTTSI